MRSRCRDEGLTTSLGWGESDGRPHLHEPELMQVDEALGSPCPYVPAGRAASGSPWPAQSVSRSRGATSRHDWIAGSRTDWLTQSLPGAVPEPGSGPPAGLLVAAQIHGAEGWVRQRAAAAASTCLVSKGRCMPSSAVSSAA